MSETETVADPEVAEVEWADREQVEEVVVGVGLGVELPPVD